MARSWLQFFPTVWNSSLGFQRKQIVIRMRMIRQLPLVLNSVRKPRQVITKPCKIIMMPLPMTASELEKGRKMSSTKTVIVSDANGTVVEVADSVDPVLQREPNPSSCDKWGLIWDSRDLNRIWHSKYFSRSKGQDCFQSIPRSNLDR